MAALEENVNAVSKHVCVVGAGPSGLVAARELRKEGHDVVVLEQKHDIGGQWLYDPNVEDEDPLGKGIPKVHSRVYASLRVASPREIMGFSDFPFIDKEGGDCRRFPGHGEVLVYLRDFCEWFGLREMIRFNTRVEYVGMLNYKGDSSHGDEDLKWIVRSMKEKKGDENKAEEVVEEVFDAVVVCNGHYSQPFLPTVIGMNEWKRKQIHSHIYRVPEPFRNEVVVVVGNSHSGQDISMELTSVAKEIHFSIKDLNGVTDGLNGVTEGLLKIIAKHSNLHLRPMIESIHEDGRVLFTDGHWVIADTIIYATGYIYSFPFLDTKGMVSVKDNRVEPLYEHTFPPLLASSLSFVGIPKRLIGFPFFEFQAKWVAQILSGRRKLPSAEQMMNSTEEFYRCRELSGIPKRYTHVIGGFDGFSYYDRYADFSAEPHVEEWRKELCMMSVRNSFANLEDYRDAYGDAHDMLRLAYQSPHFTNFRVSDSLMNAT